MLREMVPEKNQTELAEGEDGILILVRSIRIEYQKPGFLDDVITVHTTIEEMRRLSCTAHQVVMRDDDILADLKVGLAFVNASTKKPALIPYPKPNSCRTALTQNCHFYLRQGLYIPELFQ